MNICRLPATRIGWANSCYATVEFAPSNEADLVLQVGIEGRCAGLGRLVDVGPGEAELGGILVFPEFRGQGAARALVGALLESAGDRRLYCIPFTHLRTFYESFGFRAEDALDRVPPKVSSKLAWCRERYALGVELLVR